jgi:hypothetical protein
MSDDEMRQIMEQMPYGLYIVGSKMDGDVNGMMADWVMQVSLSRACWRSRLKTMRRPWAISARARSIP